nr:uncharacterized protein LOC111748934 [Loxodonta africana]
MATDCRMAPSPEHLGLTGRKDGQVPGREGGRCASEEEEEKKKKEEVEEEETEAVATGPPPMPMDTSSADEEDEAPGCLWTPLRTLDGPTLPEPDPLDLRGVFHPPTSSPSPPVSPTSTPSATAFVGAFRPSPPSSAATPSGKPAAAAAETSEFEQQLLDSHQQQGALLSSWYQQQGALMAQQNLLLQRLAEQSQRLADGVEALSRTLERLVEAFPGQRASSSTLDSAPAGAAPCGPTKGSQASPQGAPASLGDFSGMILKVEEEI